MNYLQIAILALIQGAAELLPVSSSAHVILAERLMGLDPSSPKMTFLLVMLHTGTMFAVLYYFWPRWRKLLRPTHGSAVDLTFVKRVILATAVTGVVGLGLKVLIEDVFLVRVLHHEKGEVEHLFRNLPLMASALFAVGIFIIIAGIKEGQAGENVVSPSSSFLVGLVQGLCLPFRGFSRSGATISTALLRGVARPLAEDFSFALAVVLTPPVIALQLHRLLKAEGFGGFEEMASLFLPGAVGMVLSFGSGLVALHFLSAALEKGRWKFFGFYCIGFAIVVAAASVYLDG